MKNLIITKTMNNINKYCNYDEIKFAEIKYGLESFYLFITKTFVILTIAYFLGIIKEILILLLFYNILRATGFGVHAIKSWHCWLSSTLIFLGVPMLIKYSSIPSSIMIIISLCCSIFILKYAPADTEKRPIINPKRRRIYKICCFITTIIYVIGIIFIHNIIIQSALMYSIVIETFMILPICYKIFGAKYNNYKNYLN